MTCGRRAEIAHDDEAFVFGSLAIVVSIGRLFRAVFVASSIDGVLSTYDLDPTAKYMQPEVGGRHVCGNCSRTGHAACPYEGVRPSKEQMKAIYNRRARAKETGCGGRVAPLPTLDQTEKRSGRR